MPLQTACNKQNFVLAVLAAFFFIGLSFNQFQTISGVIPQSLVKPHGNADNLTTYEPPLSYRQRLEQLSVPGSGPHSATLGVASRIYLIHVHQRVDRYEEMSKIERAMELKFTWVNATSKTSSAVTNILERIRWWRNQHRQSADDPLEDPSPFVFKWNSDVDGPDDGGPLGMVEADWWDFPLSYPESPLPPLPPAPSPDTRPPVVVSFGEDGGSENMRPHEALSLAQISCWHSHYRVIRQIAEGDDEVAIILEDDVDMEWDLEKRLRGIWANLPADWDIVKIGTALSCIS